MCWAAGRLKGPTTYSYCCPASPPNSPRASPGAHENPPKPTKTRRSPASPRLKPDWPDPKELWLSGQSGSFPVDMPYDAKNDAGRGTGLAEALLRHDDVSCASKMRRAWERRKEGKGISANSQSTVHSQTFAVNASFSFLFNFLFLFLDFVYLVYLVSFF